MKWCPAVVDQKSQKSHFSAECNFLLVQPKIILFAYSESAYSTPQARETTRPFDQYLSTFYSILFYSFKKKFSWPLTYP